MKVAVNLRAHNRAHSPNGYISVHPQRPTPLHVMQKGPAYQPFRNSLSTGSYSLINETRGLRDVHDHRYRRWIKKKSTVSEYLQDYDAFLYWEIMETQKYRIKRF